MSENTNDTAESTPGHLGDIIRIGLVLLLGGPLLWYYFLYTPAVFLNKEHTGRTLGTQYIVKIPRFPERGTEIGNWQEFTAAMQARLKHLEQCFSFNEDRSEADSEIGRFNAFTSTEDWFPVSAEVAEAVQSAQIIARLTEGDFDITTRRLYEPGQINEVKGCDVISVRLDPPGLKKTLPELKIDLSSISRGYAADDLAEFLEKQKITDYLIEIGSEVRCKGKKIHGDKSTEKDWIIGIEKPAENFAEVYQSLPLRDRSFSVCDFSKRYSSMSSAFPSRPIREGRTLLSVSVLASECSAADFWAESLFALGVPKGIELADQQGLAVLFLEEENGNIKETASKRWEK